MKKTFTGLFSISLILVATSLVLAQSQGTATWSLTKQDTVSAKVTGNVMADSENVVGLVRAYEAPTDPPTWWSSQPMGTTVQKLKPDASTSDVANTGTANSWPVEASYNPKRYVQFSFGPKSGYNMTVDSLHLWIGAKGYKEFIGAIYYSTNSDFSNAKKLAGDTDTLSEHPSLVDTTFQGVKNGPVYLGLKVSVNNGQKLYVRVYPYAPAGKNSSSKYMYIGDVVGYGTVTKATPVVNSAMLSWSLSKSDTTSVSATGDVKAMAEDTSGLQIGYDNSYTTNYVQKFKPDASTSNSTNGTGSWPQETKYNPNRYIQFAFGPKSGFDMTVDSVSMLLGDKGVKGLYADVYYSTDASFSNPRPLVQNDSLVENGAADTTVAGPNPGGLAISVKDGQTLYLRVYPWLRVSSTSTSKYMYLGDVMVYGSTQMSTAIQKTETTKPSDFALEQNYPNPFNPTTNIVYQIPQRSMVTLKVYNIVGQQVATLVQSVKARGRHIVRFDGSKLASGVYIYRLQAGSFTQAKELTLIK